MSAKSIISQRDNVNKSYQNLSYNYVYAW